MFQKGEGSWKHGKANDAHTPYVYVRRLVPGTCKDLYVEKSGADSNIEVKAAVSAVIEEYRYCTLSGVAEALPMSDSRVVVVVSRFTWYLKSDLQKVAFPNTAWYRPNQKLDTHMSFSWRWRFLTAGYDPIQWTTWEHFSRLLPSTETIGNWRK